MRTPAEIVQELRDTPPGNWESFVGRILAEAQSAERARCVREARAYDPGVAYCLESAGRVRQ